MFEVQYSHLSTIEYFMIDLDLSSYSTWHVTDNEIQRRDSHCYHFKSYMRHFYVETVMIEMLQE